MGPFCKLVNNRTLQEFTIVQDKLNETEKNAYIIENHYQPYRFEASVQIEKTQAFFLTPSREYKMIDGVIKRSINHLLYTELTP
jgi:hypothetical protein